MSKDAGDTSYVYALDKLNIISDEDFDGLELRWDKTCYSNFSSESKLQRLKEAMPNINQHRIYFLPMHFVYT